VVSRFWTKFKRMRRTKFVHGLTFSAVMLGQCISPSAWASDEDESKLLPDWALQLQENAVYRLESIVDFYPQNPSVIANTSTSDDQPVHWWNKLSVETQADLSDSIALNIDGYMSYTSPSNEQGIFTTPKSTREEARFIDFTTLNLTFETDNYDFLIGKTTVSQGYGNIASPADHFGKTNYVMPLHAIAMGVWQLKATRYLEDDKLSVTLMPFETATGDVAHDSRWKTPAASTRRFRSRELSEWGYLVRYEGVRDGLDFFVSGYYGPGAYTVSRTEVIGGALTLFEDSVQARSASAGVSYTDGPLGLYGEIFVQDTLRKKDDDFARSMVGVTYKEVNMAHEIGLEEITGTLEFSNDSVIHPQNNSSSVAGSRENRSFHNAFLGKLELVYSDKLKGTLTGIYNMEDDDRLGALEIEYKYNDDLTFNAAGAIVAGKPSSQLGRWNKNDVLSMGVKYTF